MKLITFKIQDGENSYEQYSIITKNMTEKQMLEEVYGDVSDDYREYKVSYCSDITQEQASVLQKFGIAYFN